MPNWQPNWQDVRFDHAAAAAAAAELRSTARRLRDLLHVRGRAQRTDLHGWVGPARIDWQQQFMASQREGNGLAEECERQAAHIDAAAEAARREQRSREAARETWRRERAAEVAAAEQARRARCAAEAPAPGCAPTIPRGVLR